MRTIYAIRQEPMVEGHLTECFRELRDEGKGRETTCSHCGTDISHELGGHLGGNIVATACSLSCYSEIRSDFFVPIPLSAPKPQKVQSETKEREYVAPKSIKRCPDCGGPAIGKGYRHTSDCAGSRKVETGEKEVRTCSECGGVARGRGFIHAENCSLIPVYKTNVVQKSTRTCSECGGSAVGRGFIHAENCSLIPIYKTNMVQKPKRTCSKCGGFARGRGFIHIGDCRG